MPHKSRSKGKKSVLGKRKNSPNVTQSTKDPTAGCPDYTKWPPQCRLARLPLSHHADVPWACVFVFVALCLTV